MRSNGPGVYITLAVYGQSSAIHKQPTMRYKQTRYKTVCINDCDIDSMMIN